MAKKNKEVVRSWTTKDTLTFDQIIDLVFKDEIILLKTKTVMERLNISRSTIMRWLKNNSYGFPQPDLYVAGSARWSDYTLEKWLETRTG